jgi:alkylation response protein AidB-like acyl-CoA dehydrogenase
MIPRTLFSSEHELFRDSVRTFLEKEAVPFHAQWEKQGYIDRKLWNKAGEAGMLCSHLPEEYGGLGADFLYSAVVIEEVGRLGPDRYRFLAAFGHRCAVHPALRQ